MHRCFRARGFGIKLHCVRLHAHDRSYVRRQQRVRNLRQHRVGQVLHHQAHAMRLRPATAQQCPRLSLARLQRHTRPAQLAAHFHQPPVMRALVQEQRFAGRYAMHVNGMPFQLVRKRLLNIKNHTINPRVLVAQPVKDDIDVFRLRNRAVEISRQPINAARGRNPTHLHQASQVPFRLVAPQFHFQTFQPVPPNPILQQHGVTVLWLLARQFGPLQQIQTRHQMPGNQTLSAARRQEIAGIFSLE